jgi:MscS family membrane protein
VNRHGHSRPHWTAGLIGITLWLAIVEAQPVPPLPRPAEPQPEAPTDPYGRTTPRGTVLGFLAASRKGDWEAASQYLNTRQRGKPTNTLATELFAVLDRRLPARLNQVSDRPQGSVPFPSKPNQDLIGTIDTANGTFDILVERIDRGKAGAIWLFAAETLASIPQLYGEVNTVVIENVLPSFLAKRSFLGIPVFEWLAVLIGLPGLYALGTLLNHFVNALIAWTRRLTKRVPGTTRHEFVSPPVRLLLIAAAIRWMLSRVDLPLLARQFWAGLGSVIMVAACVWLLILFNGLIEARLRARLRRAARSGTISLLRFARRTVDLLAIVVGILVIVYYFGLNPTAAIAGLGVGGIAVALAAQKTLENVIGGISLVSDNSVRVGDMLKVGDTFGAVEDVGLRSTRIRTLDRTVVSVPNGQLANLTLENVSRRDKFWVHQSLNLRFETTASAMRAVCERVKHLLLDHPHVEPDSVRVNLLNIGASSFEVEIFAYLHARDWPHFLEMQGQLLLEIMATVEAGGAQIALPSQTMYLAGNAGASATQKAKTLDGARSAKRKPHS